MAGSIAERRSHRRSRTSGRCARTRLRPIGREVRTVIRLTLHELTRKPGITAKPKQGRRVFRTRLEHRLVKVCSLARIPFIWVLVLFGIAFQIMSSGALRAQVPGAAGHEHLTEVACVDVRPGEKRPEFGCFNVGVVTGLHFGQASVYWHLRAFPSRKAAEAAKSATGIVVEEDGRVWLSEFGPRNTAPRGGEAIAIVGPLQLPAAKSYAAVLSYAVMRPGDSSRVHTHPGPEGWYVLAGEQCLETPAGANRARAGGTMTVPPNTPMELNVTGTTLRRAFALVIHDSAQERGTPSNWEPLGACSR